MKSLLGHRKVYGLIIVIGVGILAVVKAAVMGMTHDESASFFYLSEAKVWPYLFDRSAWPNANNHWLNTVAFQGAVSVFGVHEWSVRLFALLCFAAYLFYGFRLLSPIRSNALFLGGILMWSANPYLFDFFTTARGYGPALAFTAAAFYHTIIFLEKERRIDLIISGFALWLASLSLFSSVILVPTLFAAASLLYYRQYDRPFRHRSWMFWMIGWLIIFALIAATTLTPLRALSRNAEFTWGATDLIACFESLVFHSAYGQPYVPDAGVVTGFMVAFFLFLAHRGIRAYNRTAFARRETTFYLHLFALAALLILAVASRYIFGTFYPIDRKTIVFLPFLVLILSYGIDLFLDRPGRWMGTALIIFTVFHFIKSYRSDEVREWWYDRDTRFIAYTIAADEGPDPIKVGCHWMFHPTLSFYAKTAHPRLKIMQYSKEYDEESAYDYYFILSQDRHIFSDEYEVVWQNDAGRMLLKSKK